MNDRVGPALVAAAIGSVLALVLLVPYVTVQYRRRGQLGPGRAVLAFGALVYALALVAYVLLPLPTDGADFCRRYGVSPQLRLFQTWEDVTASGVSGPASLLRNPAALQVGFNALLFVPLGAFARHLFRRSVLQSATVGAVVSLLLELTQLTGVWSVYPCAYRLFDVDDVLVNTTGALLGAVVAPVLRLVPGQRDDVPAGLPRPVTAPRRLLGMTCDLLAVVLLGATLVVLDRGLIDIREGNSLAEAARSATQQSLLLWLVPALGQLALVLATGATLGEHVVRLQPVARRRLVLYLARPFRWLAGIGGFSLLQLLTGRPGQVLVPVMLALSMVAVLVTRNARGLAYAVAGLGVEDSRAPADRPGTAPPVFPDEGVRAPAAPDTGSPVAPGHR